jgi:hypothetical protein
MLPQLNGFTIFSATCELEHMATTKSNEAATQRGDPKDRWTSKPLGATPYGKRIFDQARGLEYDHRRARHHPAGKTVIIAESRAM